MHFSYYIKTCYNKHGDNMKIISMQSPFIILLISLITASLVTNFTNKSKNKTEEIKTKKILKDRKKPTINKNKQK